MARKGSLSIQKIGDWKKLDRILKGAPARTRIVVRQVISQEAHFLRGQIIKNLTSGGRLAGKPFKPNRPSTRRAKGSNKPLIDSSAMLQSIAVVEKSRSTFVGINRKTKGKQKRKGGRFAKGFHMVDLAELHELGKVINIRVTVAMLRFLHAKFAREGGGGGGTGKLVVGGVLTIRIPARPFIMPVVDKLYSNKLRAAARLLARFAKAMGGDFGRP